MDPGPLSHLNLPDDLDELAGDDPRAEALLARWDELADARLAQLAGHPVLGARLARLRDAEAWLGRGLSARRRATLDAPSAEDLFDYARGASAGGHLAAQAGPGAAPEVGPWAEARTGAPMDAERRRAVERHLADHPTEAGWVAGLQRRPPSPLLLAGAESEVGQLEEDELSGADTYPRARAPRLLRWLPLGAAAAVLAVGVTLVRQNRSSYLLPESARLRTALEEPLHFPRGRVLAAPAGAVGLFAAAPLFEFASVAGATTYRVELRRHAGGAFEVGQVVWSEVTAAPQLVGASLAPGHHTWEAFATVSGLERSLGTLDFEVVADAGTLERFTHESLVGQVQSLVREGLVTDARHRARMLPPGPERARFLGPGASPR